MPDMKSWKVFKEKFMNLLSEYEAGYGEDKEYEEEEDEGAKSFQVDDKDANDGGQEDLTDMTPLGGYKKSPDKKKRMSMISAMLNQKMRK